MQSMTSFGKGSIQLSRGVLELTIKSVNHRFLDYRMHLPRWLQVQEQNIKATLVKSFRRGSIELYWQLTQKEDQTPEIVWNKPMALKWLLEFKQLCRELRVRADINHEVVLRVPELFSIREDLNLSLDDEKKIIQLLNQVIKQCLVDRAREGKAIAVALKKHLNVIKDLGMDWRKLRKEVISNLKAKYTDKINKLGLNIEVDPQRLAQEIVIQIDKSDVSEELQRLDEHLKAVENWLKKDEEDIGKRLDFFAQEILREINTIGSKSNNVIITHGVVTAKTEIEKFREQVQNVE